LFSFVKKVDLNKVEIRPNKFNDLKKYYKRYLASNECKIERWRVAKPSQEIIDAYENKKNAFTAELNKEILEKLTALETKDIVIEDNEEVISNPVESAIVECWKNGITKQIDMSSITGFSQQLISLHIKALGRKEIYWKTYTKEENLQEKIREYKQTMAMGVPIT
jgi:hypothetical protein